MKAHRVAEGEEGELKEPRTWLARGTPGLVSYAPYISFARIVLSL